MSFSRWNIFQLHSNAFYFILFYCHVPSSWFFWKYWKLSRCHVVNIPANVYQIFFSVVLSHPLCTRHQVLYVLFFLDLHLQSVTLRMKSRPVIRSDAESVATESCTRRGQRDVSFPTTNPSSFIPFPISFQFPWLLAFSGCVWCQMRRGAAVFCVHFHRFFFLILFYYVNKLHSTWTNTEHKHKVFKVLMKEFNKTCL